MEFSSLHPPGIESLYHAEASCPYLAGREERLLLFTASRLSAQQLDWCLEHGWRTIGPMYYVISCKECRECIPLRIPVDTFRMSKSQRRILRRNRDIRVAFTTDFKTEALYRLVRSYNRRRFGTDTPRLSYERGMSFPTCPSLVSEYYKDDTLVAAGFLNRGVHGLNSVYFVYDTDWMKRSLGVFSVLAEIEYAASEGLSWYYLGYYIAGNRHMSYKIRYSPFEWYDWEECRWRGEDELRFPAQN